MASIARLASAQELTTTLTATTFTASCDGGQHTFYIYWTPGTTGNVLTFQPWFSLKDGTKVPYMEWTSAAGTKTRTTATYSETSSGTTQVSLVLSVPQEAQEAYLKVAESEAGGATKGTIIVDLISSKS